MKQPVKKTSVFQDPRCSGRGGSITSLDDDRNLIEEINSRMQFPLTKQERDSPIFMNYS
jgi:hypothetical protein